MKKMVRRPLDLETILNGVFKAAPRPEVPQNAIVAGVRYNGNWELWTIEDPEQDKIMGHLDIVFVNGQRDLPPDCPPHYALYYYGVENTTWNIFLGNAE